MDVSRIVERARQIGLEAEEIERLIGILPSDTDPEDPETELPEEPASPSHLIVGMGQASPGKPAEVDISGGTEVPVIGLGMRFGVHSALKLNHFWPTKELKELLGMDSPQLIIEQADWENSKAYGQGSYISVFLLFREKFLQSADVKRLLAEIEAIEKQVGAGGLSEEELEAARVKIAAMHKAVGEKYPEAEVIIPPMTPLLTIGIKVPGDAVLGTEYDLLNRSNWFGRPLSGAGLIKRQRINNIFGTSHEPGGRGPYRFGLEADLYSGEIEVI